MTDEKLLELAAKAAGIDFYGYMKNVGLQVDSRKFWNPLTDDGDAMRLAVKLGISLLPYPVYNERERHSVIAKQRRHTDTMRVSNPTEAIEPHNGDPYAATRRAIVRAAAGLGREMK